MDNIETRMGIMENELKNLGKNLDEFKLNMKTDIEEVKRLLKDGFVTKEEFAPVKSIVYGLVTLVLISVVGALIALVVMHK